MASSNKNRKLRIFTVEQKLECWNKAKSVEGRNPDRWRYDAVGNIVLKRLGGCMGALCYEYDHIVPYSKQGETTPENCQILQTRVNRQKSDQNPTFEEMREYSIKESLSKREMDFIEMMIYGDIKK